jgi:hypothetical protein
MPFTFAHPAFILPLGAVSKKYISFTGLVIGALVPDFEYFIRFADHSIYSHTWQGVLWFDLPLGICLSFIFHNIVRDPLIHHLPDYLKSRLLPFKDFNWSKRFKTHWHIIIVSILIGTLSHIFWDAITHETTEVLERISFFSENINSPHQRVVIYYLFWGMNSLAGIALLIYVFLRLPVLEITHERRGTGIYWTLVAFVLLDVVSVRLLIRSHLSFIDIVDTAIAAFLTGLLVVSFLVKSNYVINHK